MARGLVKCRGLGTQASPGARQPIGQFVLGLRQPVKVGQHRDGALIKLLHARIQLPPQRAKPQLGELRQRVERPRAFDRGIAQSGPGRALPFNRGAQFIARGGHPPRKFGQPIHLKGNAGIQLLGPLVNVGEPAIKKIALIGQAVTHRLRPLCSADGAVIHGGNLRADRVAGRGDRRAQLCGCGCGLVGTGVQGRAEIGEVTNSLLGGCADFRGHATGALVCAVERFELSIQRRSQLADLR